MPLHSEHVLLISVGFNSDGGDSRAGSQASPYDDTFPEQISPVEEPEVSGSAQIINGSDHSPAPYASLGAAIRPRTTIPVASFQNRREPSAMSSTITFPLQLPSSFERTWLIQQYFDNFHPAYPILEKEDCETRLSETLAQLGCRGTEIESPAVIAVDSKSSSFMALVCATCALGQSISAVSREAARDDGLPDSPPGHSMWSTSRKLLQTFDGLQPPSLDVVKCHVLNSIYALHANMVDVSLQSHAIAARLLPIASSPTRRRGDEREHSRGDINLWWNIFILDRTLSRMSDTSYMLRLSQLPDEIQRDLEAPWWQGQRCSRSPPDVPDLGSQHGQNEIAAVDGDTLYLRVMGSLCYMWSSFCDQISDPRRGSHCTMRQAALLDTELQVFAASLPAILELGTSDVLRTPERGESMTSRRLSILLVSSGPRAVTPQSLLTDEGKQSTNFLRLLIRGTSPTTCTCFSRTKTGDGRAIAHETISFCSKVGSQAASGPFIPGIAITVTTALVYSISLLLDVFDDEQDDEGESEKTSGLIEEGYGFLMQLVPTCKVAGCAVSSLDERLFSSDDDLELGGSNFPAPPSLRIDTSYADGSAQGLMLAEGSPPSRDSVPGGAPMEMERGNNLLDDLQTGYGELDIISLGQL